MLWVRGSNVITTFSRFLSYFPLKVLYFSATFCNNLKKYTPVFLLFKAQWNWGYLDPLKIHMYINDKMLTLGKQQVLSLSQSMLYYFLIFQSHSFWTQIKQFFPALRYHASPHQPEFLFAHGLNRSDNFPNCTMYLLTHIIFFRSSTHRQQHIGHRVRWQAKHRYDWFL